MGKGLKPDRWAPDAYAVDYCALYREGYRGIIFDIDNTLVPPDAPADAQVRKLFERLRQIGLRTVILSNNSGERAGRFAAEVGSAFVPGAHKPLPGKYRQAMDWIGTDVSTTVFIGDQVFTDIFGANNARMTSILTDPLTKEEPWFVAARRPFEKAVRRRARMASTDAG